MRQMLVVAASLAFAVTATAQDIPRGNPQAMVGGKKVSLDYGRPSLKGRTLDQLMAQLPGDRVWRAGANQVTTITLAGDVMVGGKKVNAGRYSLYVHAPATGDWSLLVNTDAGVPLGQIWAQAPENQKNEPWPVLQDYDKTIGSKEVARVALKKLAAPATSAEQFTMDLKAAGTGATLSLAWGDGAWSVDLTPAK